MEKVPLLGGDPKRFFLLGTSFPTAQRQSILSLLLEYSDVFTWSPYEAPGVDPDFACHSLNVDPQSRPVIQKGRWITPQHVEVVYDEVDKLIKARPIREILYPKWLSNTVVVKKMSGKLRVCVDFTGLNKAYLKDPFPFPRIDQLVDVTSGHQRMSFLDAF